MLRGMTIVPVGDNSKDPEKLPLYLEMVDHQTDYYICPSQEILIIYPEIPAERISKAPSLAGTSYSLVSVSSLYNFTDQVQQQDRIQAVDQLKQRFH